MRLRFIYGLLTTALLSVAACSGSTGDDDDGGGRSGSGGTGGGGRGGAAGSAGRGGAAGSGGAAGAAGRAGGSNGGSGGASGDPSNPFSNTELFVDGSNSAAGAEDRLRNEGKTADADLMKHIATTAQAVWFTSGSNPESAVDAAISAAGSKLRVLVAYNIYKRDCGQFSAGGAASPDAYKEWIDGFSRGVKNRKVVVILEPDTLSLDCEQATHKELVKYAVQSLNKNTNMYAYVDAAHSGWTPAGEMAAILREAGVEDAAGFAVNVSNFRTLEQENERAKAISAQLGGMGYIVDTSRNGKGPLGGEWCNPADRGLGKKSTGNTGDPLIHAYFWVKRPGESDGDCGRGEPGAGQWFESYALTLARNAAF